PELPARGLQDGADRERAPGELRRALPRAAGRRVSPPGDRRRPVGRARAPPGGRRHRAGRQGRPPGRPPDRLHPSAPRPRHADPVLGGDRVRRPAAALMRLEAVMLDAVGTLIAVAEPIGRTYARFAAQHGIALAPDEVERRFGEALADAPPAALHAGDGLVTDVEGARRAGLRAVLVDRGEHRPRLPAGVPRIAALSELATLTVTLP